LAASHLSQATIFEAQADPCRWVLEHAAHFIALVSFARVPGVHVEIFISHHDFFLPLFGLLLLLHLLLAGGILRVLAEHGLEVALLGESVGDILRPGAEDRLTVFLRPVHLLS